MGIYWVGQKVHLGISITAHRKIQTNFLAKPILCFRPRAGKRYKHWDRVSELEEFSVQGERRKCYVILPAKGNHWRIYGMSWDTMQALWLSWRYSDAGRTSWELSWVLRKRLLRWWITGRERSQADSTQHTKPGFHRGCGVPGRQAVTASLSFGQSKDRSQRELGAGSRRKGMQAYSVVSDSWWPRGL